MSVHEFADPVLAMVGLEIMAMAYITYRIFKLLNRIEVRVAPTLLELGRALGQPW